MRLLLARGERSARLRDVRERPPHAGDFLIRLVPLAGDQDTTSAGCAESNGAPDRFGAIGDDLGRRQRRRMIGENRLRVFAARDCRWSARRDRQARAATSPISGRLPRSRSPPQPKTAVSRRRARWPPGAAP
jgi:hypothetical protein